MVIIKTSFDINIENPNILNFHFLIWFIAIYHGLLSLFLFIISVSVTPLLTSASIEHVLLCNHVLQCNYFYSSVFCDKLNMCLLNDRIHNFIVQNEHTTTIFKERPPYSC